MISVVNTYICHTYSIQLIHQRGLPSTSLSPLCELEALRRKHSKPLRHLTIGHGALHTLQHPTPTSFPRLTLFHWPRTRHLRGTSIPTPPYLFSSRESSPVDSSVFYGTWPQENRPLSRGHNEPISPQGLPPLSQRPYFPQNPSTHPPSSGRTITNSFIAIFIIGYILSVQAVNQATEHRHFYLSPFLRESFQVRIDGPIGNHYWTLITHHFLYAHITHLVVDMIALNSLGPIVARTFGTRGFVLAWICGAAVSAEVEILGWGKKICQYMIQKIR